MAKQYNPHTVKEGSVMEGLFAMYCAAVLIDPDNGDSKREVTRFINSLAVNTQLKNMATKETEGPRKGQYKQAVKYRLKVLMVLYFLLRYAAHMFENCVEVMGV